MKKAVMLAILLIATGMIIPLDAVPLICDEPVSFWKEQYQAQDGTIIHYELQCNNDCYEMTFNSDDGSIKQGFAKNCNQNLDGTWSLAVCGKIINDFKGGAAEVLKKASELCLQNKNQPRQRTYSAKINTASQPAVQTAAPSTDSHPMVVRKPKKPARRVVAARPHPDTDAHPAPYTPPKTKARRVAKKTGRHLSKNARTEHIGIMAGSKAGTYIKIARDIKAIAENEMDINVYTGGSLFNIDKILVDRKSQFGMVQYDALLYKKAYFDERLNRKIKMLFPLYDEEIHVIARKGAGIDSARDLDGKKVNMDKKNSGSWVTAKIIKDALNIDWEECNYPPVDAIKRLIEGKVDAFIYVVGKPAPILERLGADAEAFLKLVPLHLDDIYVNSVFDAYTYPWQKKRVKSNATKALLVTYNYHEQGAPQRYQHYVQNIRKLIGIVHNNLDELRREKHPKWNEIDPYDYKKVKWPVHYAAKEILDRGKNYDAEEDRKKKRLFELLREYE